MAIRNFNGIVAEKRFEEPGVYPVTINGVISGMNKANTAEQDIISVITEDGFTGDMYITYTPKMMSSIKGQLSILGIDLDQGLDPQKLVGLKCNVDVSFQVQQTKDEWGNVTGSKVSDFPNIRFTSKEPTISVVPSTMGLNTGSVNITQPTNISADQPIANPLMNENPGLGVSAGVQPTLGTPAVTNTGVVNNGEQPVLGNPGVAESNVQPTLGTPVNTQPTLETTPAEQPVQQQMYDPNTGQPIQTQPQTQQRFDPNTGQPILNGIQ